MLVSGIVLSGLLLGTLVTPLSHARRDLHFSPLDDSIELAAAHGLSFGVLGGFRAIAANLVWLKTYIAWEQRDVTATEMMIRLTTALDDRPLCFWLNGARMIAYDIPAWKADEARATGRASGLEKGRISDFQARKAVSFLQRGLAIHPESSALWIERANIELNCLRDVEAAAESYRCAAEHPNAPYYPARIHAELLRRLDRKAEALAWLVNLYPTLPRHVEAAASDLVLFRIRELEEELNIPADTRFRAQGSNAASRDLTLTAGNAAL